MKMKAFLLLLASLTGYNAWAEEVRYVRDTLFVTVRSGQGVQYRILHKGIISGTRLTLLETNEETGYSRVVTPKGIEGWVQTQYLVDQPTAAIRLREAERTISQLQGDTKPLVEELSKIKGQNTELSKTIKQLKQQNAELSMELSEIKKISANAIQLDSNNRELVKNQTLLKNELDVLKVENQRLKDNSEQEGFINGIIAVGFGALLAIILPLLRPSKKRSEWG